MPVVRSFSTSPKKSFAGFLWMSDSMEMMIIAIISPILVCEWHLSRLQEASISTAVFVGQGIGALVWGKLSDMFGRKMPLVASGFFILLFGVLSSQAPFFSLMLVFRFFVGFGIGGLPQSVTILTEMLPVHRRGAAVFAMAFFWGAGSVFASALALAVSQWRHFLLILSSPLLVFLIGSWWIPESPRYLLISGQMGKLKALLRRIAAVNGTPPPQEDIKEHRVYSRARIMDLFSEEWRWTTTLLAAMWFTGSFCYFGLALLTTEMFQSHVNGCRPRMVAANSSLPQQQQRCTRLTHKDYTDFMVTGCAEIPALLVTVFLINNIGRKLSAAVEFALAALSMTMLMVCSSHNVLLVFIFIGRGLLASIFQILFLYTAEVFPTNIRSVGLGVCSMFARFGSIITPFAAQVLIVESFYLVVGVYAVPLVFSAVASLLLRIETNEKVLEDSSAAVFKPQTRKYQTFQ